MILPLVVLSGFLLAAAAPAIHRWCGRRAGWLLALLPLVLFFYFSAVLFTLPEGGSVASGFDWIPALGLAVAFRADGLSLLFALFITGIGFFVVIYAGGYLEGHEELGRFYIALLSFMASMLGLVLADNLILLFIFWELTSVTSYLLIGFDHDREASRKGALQALLVTGTGGLALLAGCILLGEMSGSYIIGALASQGDVLRAHTFYLPALLLILIAAFTKSAQFPFHFWLPAAMEAPTPVSAYLHAATMVKAGVYLLARLSPALGGTDLWYTLIPAVGAATMLVGAYVAYHQTDLKLILAYSTVSALGIFMLLLGLGSELAVKAAIVSIMAHAGYKGALFLVAGAVDHETGTRDIRKFRGLRLSMPLTAAAAMLAAISMAGLPPFFGFLSKELFYEAVLQSRPFGVVLGSVVVLASMFLLAAAGMVGFSPFLGRTTVAPRHPHEAPMSLWLGPGVMAGLGLLSGLLPGWFGQYLARPAVVSVLGRPAPVELELFHGWSPVLLLSAVAVAGGVGLYLWRERIYRCTAVLGRAEALQPSRWYEAGLEALLRLASTQTRLLQHGYLRFYLLAVVVALLGFVGAAFLRAGRIPVPAGIADLRWYEAVLVGVILAAITTAVRARSRLAAVAALGAVGTGMALIFALFGAPDLAMTQLVIETLTVILLVLVLYHLPDFSRLTSRAGRLRDGLIATGAGVLMGILVLTEFATEYNPSIASYFVQNSYTLAGGRNVVNVILTDFRGLDTLGEITVLGVAGIGVYSLLRLRPGKGGEP